MKILSCLAVFVLLLISVHTNAQELSVFEQKLTESFTSNQQINLSIDNNFVQTEYKKVVSAKLYVQINSTDLSMLTGFSADISVACQFLTSISNSEKSTSFSISENNPKLLYVMNLNYLIKNGTLDLQSLHTTFDISNIVNPQSKPLSFIETEAKLVIEYGLNASESPELEISGIIQANKMVQTFQIGNKNGIVVDFPDFTSYEFQLLKLENKDLQNLDPNKISGISYNWENALRIVTSGIEKSVKLSISEGSGLYVCRVRPIGTFYEGGITNPLNWGNWSEVTEYTEIDFTDLTTIHLPYFFYIDPNSEINWIYSRFFSEDNKIKESITFADDLLNVRQTQTHLASDEGVHIVQQTILDNAGRPTLVTIPVPVADAYTGKFKGEFVKTQDGEIYNTPHFDLEKNTPAKVDETQNGFEYYSEANPDKSIPVTEGFPFTRTIYYNESGNKVMEQSGIGETHMIGDQSAGMGRTTRYYYCLASRYELLKMFGNDAPEPGSVIKTITVDPNNIASISYVSKSGTTIATCISDIGGFSTNLEELDNDKSFTGSVFDDNSTQYKTTGGYIGTKKVFLGNQTNSLSVSYILSDYDCNELLKKNCPGACYNEEFSCKFEAKVFVRNVETGTIYPVTETTTGFVKLCEGNDAQLSKTLTGLPMGMYEIIRYLRSVDQGESEVENKDMLKPVIGKLEPMAKQYRTMAGFNQGLNELVQAYNEGTSTIYSGDIDDVYKASTGAGLHEFNLTIVHTGETEYPSTSATAPDTVFAVIIVTPCCGTVTLPLTYIPQLKCQKNECFSEDSDKQMPETCHTCLDDDLSDYDSDLPDFEQFALDYLAPCKLLFESSEDDQFASFEDYFYKVLMNGWPKGTFNKMIWHMVNDKYKEYNYVEENDTNEVKNQYKFDSLALCWINVLETFKCSECMGYDLNFTVREENTPSDKYDEEESAEGDDVKDHDESVDGAMDDMDGFFLIKWIVEKAMSKRLRELQDSEADPKLEFAKEFKIHLVNQFLECSGTKYAKVLSPYDPYPLAEDMDNNFTYLVQVIDNEGNGSMIADHIPFFYTFDNTDIHILPIIEEKDGEEKIVNENMIASDIESALSARNDKYVPIKEWVVYDPSAMDENLTGTGEQADAEEQILKARGLFPFIYNPIYAFKYFHYPANEQYLVVENSSCFFDPNDCFATTPTTKDRKVFKFTQTDNTYFVAQSLVDAKANLKDYLISFPCAIESELNPENMSQLDVKARYLNADIPLGRAIFDYYKEDVLQKKLLEQTPDNPLKHSLFPLGPNNEYAKLIVSDFYGFGKGGNSSIKCSKDYKEYTFNEKSGFRKALIAYQPKEKIKIEADWTDEMTQYDDPVYYSSPKIWYKTNGDNCPMPEYATYTELTTYTQFLIDLKTRGEISEAIMDSLTCTEGFDEGGIRIPFLMPDEDDNVLVPGITGKNANGTYKIGDKEEVSVVEREIAQQIENCVEKVDEKITVSAIEKILVNEFCYSLTGCLGVDDNYIPHADVVEMKNKIYAYAILKCQDLSTYDYITLPSRELPESKTKPGATMRSFELYVGVSGNIPDASIPQPNDAATNTGDTHDERYDQCGEPMGYITYEHDNAVVQDPLYYCDRLKGHLSANWYEYQWQHMVTSDDWKIALGIKSKCADATAQQKQDPECGNDTYMKREEYDNHKNMSPEEDANKGTVGTPVETPKVHFEFEVTPAQR